MASRWCIEKAPTINQNCRKDTAQMSNYMMDRGSKDLNVTLQTLDLWLERSPCPGLVRASWVRIPEVAEYFKRLFKVVGFLLNLKYEYDKIESAKRKHVNTILRKQLVFHKGETKKNFSRL